MQKQDNCWFIYVLADDGLVDSSTAGSTAQFTRFIDLWRTIRSLSRRVYTPFARFHESNPYVLRINGTEHRVDYQPGESNTGLFGGNSNWRGPIWFPLNFLLIESLQRFHHYYGKTFTLEFPTESGKQMTLWQVAAELSRRLTSIFTRDGYGLRPANRNLPGRLQGDPYLRDLVLFYEYFHSESGAGLGANHLTGWTGLVTRAAEPQTEGFLVPFEVMPIQTCSTVKE